MYPRVRWPGSCTQAQPLPWVLARALLELLLHHSGLGAALWQHACLVIWTRSWPLLLSLDPLCPSSLGSSAVKLRKHTWSTQWLQSSTNCVKQHSCGWAGVTHSRQVSGEAQCHHTAICMHGGVHSLTSNYGAVMPSSPHAFWQDRRGTKVGLHGQIMGPALHDSMLHW